MNLKNWTIVKFHPLTQQLTDLTLAILEQLHQVAEEPLVLAVEELQNLGWIMNLMGEL